MQSTPCSRPGVSVFQIVVLQVVVIFAAAGVIQAVGHHAAHPQLMYDHEENFQDASTDQHIVVAPGDDLTASPVAQLIGDLGQRVPGTPPGTAGPSIITVNTHSLGSSPTGGQVSITDALALAATDGVATSIRFDPAVFNTAAPPLGTNVPLQLLGDFDEIDGSGAHVVLQPLATASDKRLGVGLLGRGQALRHVTINGYQLAGVAVAGGTASPVLENVIVTNSGSHGVFITDGADTRLEQCQIANTGDDGLRVDGASATVVSTAVSNSSHHGISVWNGSLRLESSTLTGHDGLGLHMSGDSSFGVLSLPTVAVFTGCGNDSLGGNNFDPGGGQWWVHPQIPLNVDELLDPGLDLPDFIDLTQPVQFFMPFDNGKPVSISQGYNSPNTHACTISLDLTLWNGPDLTLVRAPAQGRVLRTLNFIDGPAASKSGNMVIIDHGYGILGYYTHMAHNSIQVVPGQMVDRYDIIGLGSSTGNSAGPHLHVSFYKYRSRQVWPERFPNPADHTCDDPPAWQVKFSDPSVLALRPDGIPVQGDDYVSGNAPEPAPPPFEDSHMAADMFLDRDDSNYEDDYQGGAGVIRLTNKVPLAYYQVGQEYVFEGVAPAGATAIRLAIQDYVTLQTVQTIDGLVDPSGRFSVALTFCTPGPRWINLDATTEASMAQWDFYFKSTWYPIIVVNDSGVTTTPPYYDQRILCDPERDYDCDGLANGVDNDDDEDGVPDVNDAWRDIVVNTTGDTQCSLGLWNLETALASANTDCGKTRIRFDPSAFPPNNPTTILFDRDIRTGTDGDLIDGSGAGVIFAPVDADVSRALTMIGKTGMTIRNIRFEGWDNVGQIISVSYDTKAWFDRCDLAQEPGSTGNPLSIREKAVVRWEDGDILGSNPDVSAVTLAPDSSLVMENATIMTGNRGIWADPGSQFKLCNVHLEDFNDGLYLDDSAPCEAVGVSIHSCSSDGIDLRGNSKLTLRDSSISNVDRGIVIQDSAKLRVCHQIMSINQFGMWIDDNVISGWSVKPIQAPGGSLQGGYCVEPSCSIGLNAQLYINQIQAEPPLVIEGN